MMVVAEFLVPRRPVSAQAKRRKTLQTWKEFVRQQAAETWRGKPSITAGPLQLTLVYLYDGPRADADNIIKPIQDALSGVIFSDDTLVTDVESHLRPLSTTFEAARLPQPLLAHLATKSEGVYLRLSRARSLEEYLR
jgi:hypothetical protein